MLRNILFVSAVGAVAASAALACSGETCAAGLEQDAAASEEGLYLLSRNTRAIASSSAGADATPEGYENPIVLEEPVMTERPQSSYNCSLPLVNWLKKTTAEKKGGDVHILEFGGWTGDFETWVDNTSGKEYSWTCIEPAPLPETTCMKIAGDHIYMLSNTYEIVMFNNVLHHSNATINLLKDARLVAEEYVLVVEDVRARNFTEATVQYKHDWTGLFRSETEWEQLFDLVGFNVAYKEASEYFCDYPGEYHVGRMFWALEPRGVKKTALLAETEAKA